MKFLKIRWTFSNYIYIYISHLQQKTTYLVYHQITAHRFAYWKFTLLQWHMEIPILCLIRIASNPCLFIDKSYFIVLISISLITSKFLTFKVLSSTCASLLWIICLGPLPIYSLDSYFLPFLYELYILGILTVIII